MFTRSRFALLIALTFSAAIFVAPSASASFGYVGGLNMFGQGSSGTLAQLNYPYGFARSATGEFFVADTSRHKIIKLDASGQFLLEFGYAGTGDGQFNFPNSVAISPLNGDVWVGDSGNHRIQRFDQSGGFLGKVGGTASGTGNGQFNGVGGVAIKSDGTVYVTDIFNQRVQYFDATGAYLGQFGSSGSGDGQFNRPVGISLAENGDVYVVDRLNARVQYFTPGSPHTFAGKWGCNCSEPNPVGFVAPYGIYVDQSSTPDVVYVTNDYFNHTVKRFTLAGALLNKWGPESTLTPGSAAGDMAAPVGVIADSTGTAWVLEQGNSRIQTFSDVATSPTSTGTFGTNGNADGQFRDPLGVAAAADGSVYVTDGGNKRVQHLSAKNELLHQWSSMGSGLGQFEQIGGVAVGPDGNVWVLNYANNSSDPDTSTVIRYSADGTYVAHYTSMNGIPFSYARDLDVDASGNVYLSDGGNHRVVKFADDGTFLTQWGQLGTDSGDADFQYNDGIAVNAAGTEVYVVDMSSNRVKKFDGTGGFIDESNPHTFIGSSTPGAFNQPTDIDIDPLSGDVYISDRNNNRVQRFTSDLSYVSAFGQRGRDWGEFQSPGFVSFDDDGYLWAADSMGDRVQRFGDAPVVTIDPVAASTTADAVEITFQSSDAAADCDRVSGESAGLVLGTNTISVTCTNLRGSGTASVSITREAPVVPPGPTPPGSTPTTVDPTLTLAKRIKLSIKLSFRVTCPEGCTITPKLKIGKATVRIKPIRKSAAAGPQKVTVKLSKKQLAKARKGLKQRKKLKLEVTVVAYTAKQGKSGSAILKK